MRQRIHRKPDVDPNWVDPEKAERAQRDKLHQQFIAGLSDQDSVLKTDHFDASKPEKPIKLSDLEHQKDTKLGKFRF